MTLCKCAWEPTTSARAADVSVASATVRVCWDRGRAAPVAAFQRVDSLADCHRHIGCGSQNLLSLELDVCNFGQCLPMSPPPASGNRHPALRVCEFGFFRLHILVRSRSVCGCGTVPLASSLHPSQNLGPRRLALLCRTPTSTRPRASTGDGLNQCSRGRGGRKLLSYPGALVYLLSRTRVPLWGLYPHDLIVPKGPPPDIILTGV